MKHFTEDELDQRYKSYFPSKVKGLRDVLKIAGIKENDIKIKCLDENDIKINDLPLKIKKVYGSHKIEEEKNAFKILLLIYQPILRKTET